MLCASLLPVPLELSPYRRHLPTHPDVKALFAELGYRYLAGASSLNYMWMTKQASSSTG